MNDCKGFKGVSHLKGFLCHLVLAYGTLARSHVSGNWDNRSQCGSRSVNLNNLSSNRNANITGQFTSATVVKRLANYRLDIRTLPFGRILNVADCVASI